jgi:NAD(P)-dependent dehydrogenase (short-subunit alcohol dehydrogenase family)
MELFLGTILSIILRLCFHRYKVFIVQAHLFSPSQTELQNKVILVTGAGDGIGRQAALSFAKHGAEVILLGKTVKKLEAVYDEIVAAGYIEPGIIPLDMQGATEKHYVDMGAMLIDQYGRLDGILHNASILGHLCPFNQITSTEFNDVMQVNVTAQFLMTQGVLPALQKSEHGSIIFTTSSVGREGRAFWGTYSISKFATEGMTQVMASEYANSHIRVNCINPGATRTTMRGKAFPAEDPQQLKTPLDIMPSYIYLMSDQAVKVNGQSIDCQPK